MIPECEFANVQTLAHETRETAKLFTGLDLSPRPWNRFEPENTRWWLVPSTDWPAYHHGKLSFDPTEKKADVLYCGFDVEKGFGPIVGEGYPSTRGRNLIMGASWTWHRFVTDLTGGVVGDVVQEVAQRTGRSLRLEFRADYASDPDDFDPEAPLSTRIVFEISENELAALGSEGEEWRFQPVGSCTKLADLRDCIEAIPGLDWIWIDLYLGILVGRRQASTALDQRGELWSSSELWEKALMPWRPWLV